MTTPDPDDLVLMSPEEYQAAYLAIHDELPPDDAPPTDDHLPDCDCRT